MPIRRDPWLHELKTDLLHVRQFGSLPLMLYDRMCILQQVTHATMWSLFQHALNIGFEELERRVIEDEKYRDPQWKYRGYKGLPPEESGKALIARRDEIRAKRKKKEEKRHGHK